MYSFFITGPFPYRIGNYIIGTGTMSLSLVPAKYYFSDREQSYAQEINASRYITRHVG